MFSLEPSLADWLSRHFRMALISFSFIWLHPSPDFWNWWWPFLVSISFMYIKIMTLYVELRREFWFVFSLVFILHCLNNAEPFFNSSCIGGLTQILMIALCLLPPILQEAWGWRGEGIVKQSVVRVLSLSCFFIFLKHWNLSPALASYPRDLLCSPALYEHTS